MPTSHQTSVLGSSIHFGGVAVIQLHAALKRDAALYVLLHELGHVWLHPNDGHDTLMTARTAEIRRRFHAARRTEP